MGALLDILTVALDLSLLTVEIVEEVLGEVLRYLMFGVVLNSEYVWTYAHNSQI